jgi:ethanolamine utilization microcompartment shell protein EutS
VKVLRKQAAPINIELIDRFEGVFTLFIDLYLVEDARHQPPVLVV